MISDCAKNNRKSRGTTKLYLTLLSDALPVINNNNTNAGTHNTYPSLQSSSMFKYASLCWPDSVAGMMSSAAFSKEGSFVGDPKLLLCFFYDKLAVVFSFLVELLACRTLLQFSFLLVSKESLPIQLWHPRVYGELLHGRQVFHSKEQPGQ